MVAAIVEFPPLLLLLLVLLLGEIPRQRWSPLSSDEPPPRPVDNMLNAESTRHTTDDMLLLAAPPLIVLHRVDARRSATVGGSSKPRGLNPALHNPA